MRTSIGPFGSCAMVIAAMGLAACGGDGMGRARAADSAPPGSATAQASVPADSAGESEFPVAEEPTAPLVESKPPGKAAMYSKADRPTIRCEVMWRATVLADPSDPKTLAQKTRRLELTPGVHKKTVLGPFVVDAHYEVHEQEGDSLRVGVTSHAGDSSRQLFQFDGRVMERPSLNHGFTGLIYRTLPDRPDELQYWCSLAS